MSQHERPVSVADQFGKAEDRYVEMTRRFSGKTPSQRRGVASMPCATDEVGVTSAPRRRLIVVDDDDAVRRSLHLILQSCGFDVRSFACATPALEDLRVIDAAAIVVDQRLPDIDGVSLLATLRGRGWGGRAVMITAFPSLGLTEAARQQGCDTVLEKPLHGNDLLLALGERLDADL